jgi:hypothetical protein
VHKINSYFNLACLPCSFHKVAGNTHTQYDAIYIWNSRGLIIRKQRGRHDQGKMNVKKQAMLRACMLGIVHAVSPAEI